MPAAVTSVLLTVQPVCAVFFAAILLDEAPTGLQLLGVAAILAGLVLASAKRPAREPAVDPRLALGDRGE